MQKLLEGISDCLLPAPLSHDEKAVRAQAQACVPKERSWEDMGDTVCPCLQRRLQGGCEAGKSCHVFLHMGGFYYFWNAAPSPKS